MTNEFINKTLGIEEAYQMPERMMQILEDEQLRERIFDLFLSEEPNLSYDWFTDYFQTEHGDRDKLKQDFTPDCIGQILNGMNDTFDTLADICAGTGGLTIKMWTKNKDGFFHCEELAKRAVPILLFNMAIRGMNGEVINSNVLTKEVFAVYSLKRNGRYSSIECARTREDRKYDSVIMNPPYSLSWSGQPDPRFEKYGTPPKSKADYAFVLHGLHQMKDTGKLLAVLPHGVLFRGQRKGDIRRNLVKDNLVKTVIGLPDNLFLNTAIPTCIVELKKSQKGIFFIDASKEFEKQGSRSFMREGHIETVMNAYKMRRCIEKFSYLAAVDEVERNDFNLNIPRYVDTFEPEEIPDLAEIFNGLLRLEKETKETENQFYKMLKELVGTDEEAEERIRQEEKIFQRYLEEKNGQIRMVL